MKTPKIAMLIWGLVGALFVSLFIAYAIDFYIESAAQITLKQQELEQEFKSIKPPSEAIACQYHVSHKIQQASVGSTYLSKLPYQKIRAHYDAELSSHGWQFQKEREVRDWGRDFGGSIAYYCKDSYTASLQYAGDDAGYGWSFGFDLGWRHGNVCPQK